MEARQLVPSNNDDGRTSRARLCQSVNLPANGILTMPNGEVITLTGPAAFKPACATTTQPAIIAGAGNGGVILDETATIAGPNFSDLSDPFYASTFPQCYALAATTVIAYTLVIMLLITPRSFLDGGVVVLGRRGFTSGGTGSGTIGGRPWLQKVAALTVAVSLTIATADTFRVAEKQYALGLQDARELRDEVLGGTELKVIRIISDTFLWLAQAQTLIRLFPRQREKVIIKWTAFALVTFDLIFDSLNSFQYSGPGNTRPGSFTDAIPALSYLFQLALGVLYAAWVIYYSLMKKRYAYYHPQMKNMSLVAALSLLAILVPIVFFILDISQPEFTAWGDYVRWVGAAAASVIVWEWVERIEALEREEKKDGILGREVFDGDEMLDTSPDSSWPRRYKGEKADDGFGDDDDGGEGGEGGAARSQGAPTASGRSNIWPTMSSIANRYRQRSQSRSRALTRNLALASSDTEPTRPAGRFLQPPLWPSRPQPAVTPVSRTDTTSADSTVYAIRYHPLTETTTRTTANPPSPSPTPAEHHPSGEPLSPVLFVSERPSSPPAGPQSPRPLPRSNSSASNANGTPPGATSETPSAAVTTSESARENESAKRWRTLALPLPFRRSPRSDVNTLESRGPGRPPHSQQSQQIQQPRVNRWDLRSRMEDFAATQAERIREKIRPTPDTESLPVTVIPAPARRGAALTRLLEEEESSRSEEQSPASRHQRRDSHGEPPVARGPPPSVTTSAPSGQVTYQDSAGDRPHVP